MQSNDASLEGIMKPEIYAKVTEALKKLKSTGYRTKLINRWEKVFEQKVYGYMRYEGLSPLFHQNFSYNCYKIHQINVLHFPIRMEFFLDKSLLKHEKETRELVKSTNPFDIRDTPRDSVYLYNMLEKYPVSIVSADIGLLSRLKFHIIDLYSKNSIAEGEVTGDEYEFHLLRFEKVFPKDLKRYEQEIEYKRFLDTNFNLEQSNWLISDIDQYMNSLPISNN